jgi:polysaccharide chain length determinant protein (PEP-CTERM system associated)
VTELLTLARRYAIAGWRHKWKALLLAWLVCLGGWAYVYTLPNQYRSSARIHADADAILGQVLSGIAVDSRPSSQVEVLQRTLFSRPNLERVAARTGLDLRADSAASREALLKRLEANLRLGLQTRNLFTITYTDTDARMSRDVVQALLTLFMERATANDRQQMENARTFVNQQIQAYEAQLREAEQRRAEFRTRYADLLPSETGGGATGLDNARSRLRTLQGNLQDAEARRDRLKQELEAIPPTLRAGETGAPGVNPAIAEAERTLRELRLQYTDQHPGVAAARNRLAELRATGGGGGGGGGGATVPNPLYEPMRTRLLDAEGQVNSLQRQVRQETANVERLEALARTVPQLQAQFANLDRDYTVLRRSYEELLERRESVQIAGAARSEADRVRLEVVDPPTVPLTPVGPNRFLFATGVLAAGVGAGIALALLFVLLDRSFYTVLDLRKLGLPVIGSISSTEPPRRQGFAVVAFACGFGLLLFAYGAITAGGPALIARIPNLVARFIA